MEFDYKIQNNEVTITKYRGTSKNVIIPNKIENISVTTIGNHAFYFNKLTSIVLPETLITIGKFAFMQNKLINIVLPETLTTIGDCAFSRNRLTSIVLPETLTNIGEYAFHNNTLTSIVLPETLTTIGQAIFHCNKLTSIVLPDNFQTEEQVQSIFKFSLEELENKNRKFVTPYYVQITIRVYTISFP